MARIAAAIDIPLAAGENDYGRQGFRRLIEARAIDIAMIDLQRAGGISEWMKIAAMADARAHAGRAARLPRDLGPHAGGAAAAPFLEHMSWWEPLFRERLALEGGCVRPPAAPGLGLSFDENFIATIS